RRDGAQARVVDLADRGTLFDVNVNDPALCGLFAFKPDVLEVRRVPQRIEVSFERSLVVHISRLGEDTSFDRFTRDTTVARNPDVNNQVFLTPCRGRHQHDQSQPEGEKARPPRPAKSNTRPSEVSD